MEKLLEELREMLKDIIKTIAINSLIVAQVAFIGRPLPDRSSAMNIVRLIDELAKNGLKLAEKYLSNEELKEFMKEVGRYRIPEPP